MIPPAEPLWYYSHAGQRLGPVPASAFPPLVANGIVTGQTLVWRYGMSDWAAAQQTEIAALLGQMKIAPPPLMGEAVNNSLVWTLAFVPIIGGFLQYFLAGALQTPVKNLWFVTLVLNVCCCLADEGNLKKAGHDTKGMGIWAFLLVPAYLFIRAARLKQSNGYAIVWLVTFILSLLLF